MTKSASQRKATERQRKRESGLVPVEVWIRPEHKGKLKEFEREHGKMNAEKIYMNIETGSVDTFDGWYYENNDGDTVNAVELGEVVEVAKNEDGDWVEVYPS